MKNVLITGTSRGFGYALAEAYAGQGFHVIACARNICSSKLKKLQETYPDLVDLVNMDVADTDSVEKAALVVREKITDLDILINNAAVHAVDSQSVLEEVNVDNCLDVFNINTLGALRVTKAFLSLLEKSDKKELVNISSESGSITDYSRIKEFDYALSKAALNMESKILQNYLANRGIKVLTLHPGWMRTEMGGEQATYTASESAISVMKVIEQYQNQLDGPIFVDNFGNSLNY